MNLPVLLVGMLVLTLLLSMQLPWTTDEPFWGHQLLITY